MEWEAVWTCPDQGPEDLRASPSVLAASPLQLRGEAVVFYRQEPLWEEVHAPVEGIVVIVDRYLEDLSRLERTGEPGSILGVALDVLRRLRVIIEVACEALVLSAFLALPVHDTISTSWRGLLFRDLWRKHT